MSLASVILGLPELEVERVDRNNAIAVHAKPRQRPCCLYCQYPKIRIKATYQRTLKHTRQGNQLMTLYLRTPKYHCPRCGRYFRHRFKGIRPRFRASETLSEYAGVRSAAAEIATGIATLGAGAAAFQQLTPGAISLGPALAAALAQQAAVSAFPLGATAGSVWYGFFPAAASPALVAGATAGMAAVGAVAAAFAGVVADPVQAKLGVHQRRLKRLIDALEHEFLEGEGPGFAAREHYAARIMDVVDMGLGVARHLRA